MKPLSGNFRTSYKDKHFIIAIDGPAASGKSTAAYLLAKKMGFIYLDTGAMYRAITWMALNENTDLENEKSLSNLARKINIKIYPLEDHPGVKVYVDEKDISSLIRSPLVNKWVSVVSKISGVRKAMVEMQRKIARERSVVAEGRDIGTVVFPNADVKIFLVASLEERAKRRWKEFQEKGISCSLEEVKKDLEARDKLDRERNISPLRKAEDALVVDNTHLGIFETLDRILNVVKDKIGIEKNDL